MQISRWRPAMANSPRHMTLDRIEALFLLAGFFLIGALLAVTL